MFTIRIAQSIKDSGRLKYGENKDHIRGQQFVTFPHYCDDIEERVYVNIKFLKETNNENSSNR